MIQIFKIQVFIAAQCKNSVPSFKLTYRYLFPPFQSIILSVVSIILLMPSTCVAFSIKHSLHSGSKVLSCKLVQLRIQLSFLDTGL